jgi:hypothetical protein
MRPFLIGIAIYLGSLAIMVLGVAASKPAPEDDDGDAMQVSDQRRQIPAPKIPLEPT